MFFAQQKWRKFIFILFLTRFKFIAMRSSRFSRWRPRWVCLIILLLSLNNFSQGTNFLQYLVLVILHLFFQGANFIVNPFLNFFSQVILFISGIIVELLKLFDIGFYITYCTFDWLENVSILVVFSNDGFLIDRIN